MCNQDSRKMLMWFHANICHFFFFSSMSVASVQEVLREGFLVSSESPLYPSKDSDVHCKPKIHRSSCGHNNHLKPPRHKAANLMTKKYDTYTLTYGDVNTVNCHHVAVMKRQAEYCSTSLSREVAVSAGICVYVVRTTHSWTRRGKCYHCMACLPF